MSFFSTVVTSPALRDDSWASSFETAANAFRAPGRWLAKELWNGGKKYVVVKEGGELVCANFYMKNGSLLQRVLRVVLGLLFSIPGQIIAAPLMAVAYTDEVVRLKHKFVERKFTADEKSKLLNMMEERARLAKERQGCEPVSCLLASICSLLCISVCCK